MDTKVKEGHWRSLSSLVGLAVSPINKIGGHPLRTLLVQGRGGIFTEDHGFFFIIGTKR